jgi:hypothetical protein
MSSRRLVAALAVAVALGLPSLVRAQYSQMAQPGTWSGGGAAGFGGGYAGGYGGGYAGGYGNGYGGYGGGYGVPGNLTLIARQSDEVHGQIADLLDQLRRMQGQQVAIATPFHTVTDDFYERIGVNFGFNINAAPFNPNGGSQVVGLLPDGSINPAGSIMFTQGGANSALPQFGGHDPATDATLGFAALGGDASAFFNFFAGQGSNRTHVSQVPRVVIQNGTQGSISDTSQTPFVTGLVPVVGGYGFHVPTPYFPVMQASTYNPLHDRIRQYQAQQQRRQEAFVAGEPFEEASGALAVAPEATLSEADTLSLKVIESRGSTAGHGDLSVAEIKRLRAEQEAAKAQIADAELLTLIERARGAEEAGKPGVAKIYYRQAASRATGETKQQLQQKINELE